MTEPVSFQRFSNKATWVASELDRPPMTVMPIDEAGREELKAALAIFRQHGRGRYPDKQDFPLPSLGPLLRGVQDELETGYGAVLFQGFPLDCGEEDAVLMFSGLLSYVGSLVPQTVLGEKLQPVQDEGQARLDERRGSKHNLGLPVHNDGCDVVGFLCRRRPLSGGTSILVSAEAVHNALLESDPEALAALYENYDSAWQDYLFPEGRNTDTTKLPRTWSGPIFSQQGGKLCCRYSRFYIDRAQTFPGIPAMPPRKLAALDALDRYLYDADRWQYRRNFEVGDVLLLNNHVLLHSRTAFVDGEALENRRQLYRAWLSMPNSRPLDASLACFFGNCGPGEIRGGVKSDFMAGLGSA